MGYLSDLTSKLDENQNVIFVGTGILLVNTEGEILIAKRTDNEQWSLPGGSLEIGESLEKCIIRETLEETGIEISEGDLELNSAKSVLEPVIKRGREIFVVSITFWTNKFNASKIKIDKREFSGYKWVNIKDIKNLNGNITSYSMIAIKEYFKNRGENCI